MALAKKTSKFHRKTQQILDRRPCEIVPVGAWVELCPQGNTGAYAAVIAAQREEERLCRLQAEKEAKLARFRQEVRSRVRELQRIKKQQQLQESFQAVNLQGRVVQRTTPSANILSHRRDACVYQSSDPHAIGNTPQPDIPRAWERSSRGNGLTVSEQVREQAGQTRRLVQKAKHDLAAKQLAMKPKVDSASIPGGLWGSSFSRDRPSLVSDTQSSIPPEPRRAVIDLDMTSSTHSDLRIPQEPIEGALYDESGDFPPASRGREPLENFASQIKHVTFAPGLRISPQVNEEVIGRGQGDFLGVNELYKDLPLEDGDDRQWKVTLPHQDEEYSAESDVTGHGEAGQMFKGQMVPEVNPGVVAEELKRQHGLQFSMYRRLYMDIEREQVRENMRKKTHHKKIQQLKKAKEQERLEVERQSELKTNPGNILGETEMETRQREVEEAQEIQKIQTRLRQKNKETKRFIQALRAMMKERVDLLGVNPPPLCACGPTVWDANPDTCANNCIFYKNPKAYAKALASVLTLNDTG